ncbi:hypothetical protein G6M86_03565 [Agrobacterium tumefaciens]|uniref:Uncharacterized protein n=1 Tax=Agrobacterium tumefaciens TaxID=358 RepID=A0AAJ4T8V2_AGRTU|nr:hypothetical protein G6M86_03565 [Agrobacterium tumefaciens]
MDNDTKTSIFVCACLTVAFLSLVHGCTTVFKTSVENRHKTICLEQAKQWQDGNCIR